MIAARDAQRPVSISAAPYDGHAFPVLCDSMAACGVRFVEPAFIVGYTEPFDETMFSDAKARQYRRWLEASGLGCHAFSSHIDLGRSDAVAVFTRRMEFAASLGARVINTNAALRANAARFHANIAPLARRAAALGMVIGLENPGNGEDNLINDTQEGLALIRALDLESVRLNYDPGNTVSHRPGRIDATADALLALPGCAHFHVKECGAAMRAGASRRPARARSTTRRSCPPWPGRRTCHLRSNYPCACTACATRSQFAHRSRFRCPKSRRP